MNPIFSSRTSLYLKHRVCGTVFDRPLHALRSVRRWRKISSHPGLAEVLSEDIAVDHYLKKTIRPAWNCIDVGAHIGSFTAKIIRLAPNGKHVALEAIPYKAAWIARRWKEISVHNCAAGDSVQEVAFFENASRPGFSSLGMRKDSANHRDKIQELRVAMLPLDEILSDVAHFDFIKIDVEGAELGVLRGCSRMIARCSPIILFESGPGGAESCGYRRRDLYDFFRCRGFSVYLPRHALYNREPLTPDEFERSHVYPFRAFNYFAIPDQEAQ